MTTAPYIDLEDDALKIFDAVYQQGWTDGLPIVPPTEQRVEAMMKAVDREPYDLVAVLPPKNGQATVQKLAVNAVMAGCLPSYFPVVVAAIEAAADPAFYLLGLNCTTNPGAPLMIVNGPIRHEIGINCAWSCLGPGARANATIGRAVSLAMLNIAGRVPREVSKATHSMPGRFAFCVGEWEEESPWEPLHVERGFKKTDSTVTLLAPAGTTNVLDHLSQTGPDILTSIAWAFAQPGSNNLSCRYGEGDMGLIVSPPHARLLVRDLGSKAAVKQALLEKANRILPLQAVPTQLRESIQKQDSGLHQIEDGYVRVAARADQFVLIVAGGLTGLHSVALPTFGGPMTVTRVIKSKATGV